MTQEIFLY